MGEAEHSCLTHSPSREYFQPPVSLRTPPRHQPSRRPLASACARARATQRTHARTPARVTRVRPVIRPPPSAAATIALQALPTLSPPPSSRCLPPRPGRLRRRYRRYAPPGLPHRARRKRVSPAAVWRRRRRRRRRLARLGVRAGSPRPLRRIAETCLEVSLTAAFDTGFSGGRGGEGRVQRRPRRRRHPGFQGPCIRVTIRVEAGRLDRDGVANSIEGDLE